MFSPNMGVLLDVDLDAAVELQRPSQFVTSIPSCLNASTLAAILFVHPKLNAEVLRMRTKLVSIAVLVLVVTCVDARADETIVFFRHGEKPSGGYGQLTCQGFNRALALPHVLTGKFGTPDVLYAPSPAVKVTDTAG